MELELKRQLLQNQIARGQGLAPMPDGPALDRYCPLELAQALEHEVNRAHAQGHTKIRIDLSFEDCLQLARTLRRAVLLGV
jgi:hypothetical protein